MHLWIGNCEIQASLLFTSVRLLTTLDWLVVSSLEDWVLTPKLNCIGIQVISTMEGALSVTVRLVKKKSYWYKINPVYKHKTLQIFGPIGSSPDNKQINKNKAATLMKLI